jgi:hypothetical protein
MGDTVVKVGMGVVPDRVCRIGHSLGAQEALLNWSEPLGLLGEFSGDLS